MTRNFKIGFSFLGEPLAAPRMTKGTLWKEHVRNYLAYKKGLAEAISLAFPELVLILPATVFKKERAKALKEYKDERYKLTYHYFYCSKYGPDCDNLKKTLCDAIQDSGIIVNDRRIKEGGAWAVYDYQRYPRIDFGLEVLK